MVQKFHRVHRDKFEFLYDYYDNLFNFNRIGFTKLEVRLVAYAAMHQAINSAQARESFIKRFGIALGSYYNALSKLQRKKIFIKVSGKIILNPRLRISLESPDYTLSFNIKYLPKDE